VPIIYAALSGYYPFCKVVIFGVMEVFYSLYRRLSIQIFGRIAAGSCRGEYPRKAVLPFLPCTYILS